MKVVIVVAIFFILAQSRVIKRDDGDDLISSPDEVSGESSVLENEKPTESNQELVTKWKDEFWNFPSMDKVNWKIDENYAEEETYLDASYFENDEDESEAKNLYKSDGEVQSEDQVKVEDQVEGGIQKI